MTVDDLFRMLYEEVPAEFRGYVHWVMTKDDWQILKRKMPESEHVPAGLATHLIGKPIQFVENIDGVRLAYLAPARGVVGKSALYEPCADADCPAHRVGYGHGHLVAYEPEPGVESPGHGR